MVRRKCKRLKRRTKTSSKKRSVRKRKTRKYQKGGGFGSFFKKGFGALKGVWKDSKDQVANNVGNALMAKANGLNHNMIQNMDM